jgi:hypothetical protein
MRSFSKKDLGQTITPSPLPPLPIDPIPLPLQKEDRTQLPSAGNGRPYSDANTVHLITRIVPVIKVILWLRPLDSGF